MIFSLILMILTPGHVLTEDGEEQIYRALSFGETVGDYVQFSPADMSPFESSFTGCAWIKRLHDASEPVLLHYLREIDEIAMSSNGYWNIVRGGNLDLSGKFPGKNMWFHYCMAWNAEGQHIVYINGQEVGSTSASTGNLAMGGEIAIGNSVYSAQSSDYIFGGQLFRLNLFSEVLSPADIRNMNEAGLCSTAEMKYGSRQLTWESILAEKRYGNVTEFIPDECYNRTIGYFKEKLQETTSQLKKTQTDLLEKETKLNLAEDKLNVTEITLQETRILLNDSRTELVNTKTDLTGALEVVKEKTKILNETQTELKKTRKELQDVEEQLTNCETQLNQTLSQLARARKIEDVSRWDVLLTPSYLNKLFTRQLYNKLVGNWDMMEKFIGVNVTVGFVEHFRDHHEEYESFLAEE